MVLKDQKTGLTHNFFKIDEQYHTFEVRLNGCIAQLAILLSLGITLALATGILKEIYKSKVIKVKHLIFSSFQS